MDQPVNRCTLFPNWIDLEYQLKDLIIEVAMRHLYTLVSKNHQTQDVDLVQVYQIDLAIMNLKKSLLKKLKLLHLTNTILKVNLVLIKQVALIPYMVRINQDPLV